MSATTPDPKLQRSIAQRRSTGNSQKKWENRFPRQGIDADPADSLTVASGQRLTRESMRIYPSIPKFANEVGHERHQVSLSLSRTSLSMAPPRFAGPSDPV